MAASKKTWGKLAKLSLVMLMAGTVVLSGCSSKSGGSTDTSGGSSGSNDGKQVTLKVEIFDRGNTPEPYTITDSYLTRYIQDNFGTPNNIKMEFVPVPRSEEIKKLNVLMASGGDVPDIVFTYDTPTFNRYAEQGGLTELTDLINEHGPNLKAFLDEDAMSYGQYMGKQFAVPGKRAFLGKYSSFIRTDWLDKLGMDVPQTTEELYEVLKAFKEKDPGKPAARLFLSA